MGANTFQVNASGKNAAAAFDSAVKQAEYDYGHAGYTGTIAEKDDFTIIPISEIPEEKTPYDYAESLLYEGDQRIDRKWGPAGAIHLGGEEWLFFGWASS